MAIRRVSTSLLVMAFWLMVLNGCNRCSWDSGGIFFQQLWRTWKLIRVATPSKSQTNFSYQERLKMTIANDGNGNGTTRDSLFRDSVLISTQTWRDFGEDCSTTTVWVTYKTGVQRKYWLSNRGEALEATGYVDAIGGPADTVRYFYVALP